MERPERRWPRGALAAALAAAALRLFACKSNIDPDQGRFHCTTPDDCGKGYVCISQQAGGALCFKQGECLDHEECNGKDDNCDGVVDETFPGRSDPCLTGLKGICGSGNQECSDGGIVCQQMVFSRTETCDGQDEDCDGVIDNGFNKQTDDNNCGTCGHVCPSGTRCLGGVCHESNCVDGLDNDLDGGGADCADVFCASQLCFTDPDGGVEWHCAARPDGGLDGGDDGGLDGGDDGGLDGGNDGGLDGGGDAGEPDAGSADGGADGGGADGGIDGGLDGGPGPGCYAPETDCANGLDDDHDGLTDCADPKCDGKVCFTGAACAMGNCPPAG